MRIEHHNDARGPAINVKVYRLDDVRGTDQQRGRAYDMLSTAWWQGAEGIAQKHGFRGVGAAGRMGGWLYTDPMPEEEYPQAFVDEIEALLKRVPEMFGEILEEVIADDAREAEAVKAEAVANAAIFDAARFLAEHAGASMPLDELHKHARNVKEALAVLDGDA